VELSNILALVALVVTVIGGSIAKVMFSRAFKASDVGTKALADHLDAELSNLSKRLDGLIGDIDNVAGLGRNSEKDIIKLQSCVESLNMLKAKIDSIDTLKTEFLEKFVKSVDFIRELQVIISQIDAIFRKVDQLDSKVSDRLDKIYMRGNHE